MGHFDAFTLYIYACSSGNIYLFFQEFNAVSCRVGLWHDVFFWHSQHLISDQPGICVVEQHTGPVGACPAHRVQPATKPKMDTLVYELAITISQANFRSMSPALFAVLVCRQTQL